MLTTHGRDALLIEEAEDAQATEYEQKIMSKLGNKCDVAS